MHEASSCTDRRDLQGRAPGALNLRMHIQMAGRMAIKNDLLGEGCGEGEERVRVSKRKFVLTNSVLYSRESLYEYVVILGKNSGNPIA